MRENGSSIKGAETAGRTMTSMFKSALVITASALLFSQSASAASNCVQVFYDASKNSSYSLGKVYSVFLQNLLGHFPEFQQRVAPIESYKAGQLDQCRTSFYIGSYFDNEIPEAFLQDFASTRRNVVWLGYSVWRLGSERMERIFGYQYERIRGLDWQNRDPFGAPTFFKYVLYKGETFSKIGHLTAPGSDQFVGPYELIGLRRTSHRSQVLAEAIHNHTGERLPYIIRGGESGNKYFVADNPFTFIHEDDRYLVFSDILFDALEASPRHPGRKHAVIRIEDVNLAQDFTQLRALGDLFQKYKAPFHLATIPIFADPYNDSGLGGSSMIPLNHAPEFAGLLQELQAEGASIIWHGVTHQYARMKNPTNGMSGDDFEFWDIIRNRPVQEDSPRFVLNRLDAGWRAFESVGIRPQIWEVPHYQASALDYHLFSRVFSWNIGRIMYSDHKVTGLPASRDPELWFESSGLQGSSNRWASLKNVQAEQATGHNGQFFPYEIYGDVYGQRVLPENLGNVQPDGIFGKARSIDDLIATARRNRVLRDAWASFFFHAYLLRDEGSRIEDVERLIIALKDLGYEFIDLEEFIRDRKAILRPEPRVLTGSRR